MQKQATETHQNDTKTTIPPTKYIPKTTNEMRNLALVARRDRTRHKKQLMVEALVKTKGIVKYAAAMVGIDRKTHQTWMRKDEKYAEKVYQVEDEALDLAEQVVLASMAEQTKDPKTALKAAQFYLENKGASRGYGKLQIALNNTNNNLNMGQVNVLAELRKLQEGNNTSTQ